MGDGRVPARAGLSDGRGGTAGRPLRPPSAVPDRGGRVRRRLGRMRGGAERGAADRGAGAPGRGRRTADPARIRERDRRHTRRAQWLGDRRRVDRSDGIPRPRPAARRRHRGAGRMALDLPDKRAGDRRDSQGRRPLVAGDAQRGVRATRRPGAGPARGWPGVGRAGPAEHAGLGFDRAGDAGPARRGRGTADGVRRGRARRGASPHRPQPGADPGRDRLAVRASSQSSSRSSDSPST